MKSNSVVSINRDGTKLAFTVIGNPQTLTVDTSAMSAEMREQAMFHGLAQKVRDAAAIKRVVVNGMELAATPAHKHAAMQRVVDALTRGEWNAPRKSGDRIGADESLLSRALVAVYPARDAAEIRAKVVGMTAEERKALLMVPKIKAAADAIRAAEVADVDTEELLADFE